MRYYINLARDRRDIATKNIETPQISMAETPVAVQNYGYHNQIHSNVGNIKGVHYVQKIALKERTLHIFTSKAKS